MKIGERKTKEEMMLMGMLHQAMAVAATVSCSKIHVQTLSCSALFLVVRFWFETKHGLVALKFGFSEGWGDEPEAKDASKKGDDDDWDDEN